MEKYSERDGEMMHVINDNAVTFNCVIDGFENMIEIYDARFDHTTKGQLVAEYYISTIKNIQKGHGLNLQGGVKAWYLTGQNISEIQDWLNAS